jgi:hypothetical protein
MYPKIMDTLKGDNVGFDHGSQKILFAYYSSREMISADHTLRKM